MKIPVHRMNHKARFGYYDATDNDLNGYSNANEFVAKFELHYANWNRTIMQNDSLLGTENIDTRIIAIRSNSKVDKNSVVKLADGTDCKIMNISKSSDDKPVKYDLLTIKAIKKGVSDHE